MVTQLRHLTENDHLRAALDWTVFSLGVLSLTIAIAATILDHSGNRHQDVQATAVPTVG